MLSFECGWCVSGWPRTPHCSLLSSLLQSFSRIEEISMKKSQLSLNETDSIPNEWLRAIWKFFFWVYDGMGSHPRMRGERDFFSFSSISFCLKAYLTLLETIFNREKSHLKQRKHKNFIPFIKAIKNSIYILC